MSNCRLLVADDAPDIRLILRATFEMVGGFDVVAEAVNGEEAVALATVHQPDIVLLDLSMPVMDGLEALPLVREAASGAVVIVVSGFLNDDVKQQVLDLGAHGFVEKGNDLSGLTDYVAAVWAELTQEP